MRCVKIKTVVLLFVFFLPVTFCNVFCAVTKDGHSHINVKASHVQGTPKGSSIQASINGHWLSVVFLENLGQVNVAIMAVGGSEAQSESTPTPNGVDFYIPFTGNYIVYFTLPNGDTYYGEFEVTD